MKKKEYDVVICGAGAAGLLFAYRLNQDPFFKNHSVLLIEAAQKKTTIVLGLFGKNSQALWKKSYIIGGSKVFSIPKVTAKNCIFSPTLTK